MAQTYVFLRDIELTLFGKYMSILYLFAEMTLSLRSSLNCPHFSNIVKMA